MLIDCVKDEFYISTPCFSVLKVKPAWFGDESDLEIYIFVGKKWRFKCEQSRLQFENGLILWSADNFVSPSHILPVRFVTTLAAVNRHYTNSVF